MTNSETFLVSGTYRQAGAIGEPESFQVTKKSNSSRNAYVSVRDALYNDGYETIHVIAIKMCCAHCGQAHVTVDPNLYLY